MKTIDITNLETITGGNAWGDGRTNSERGAEIGGQIGASVGNWFGKNASRITDAAKTIYAPPPTFPQIPGMPGPRSPWNPNNR